MPDPRSCPNCGNPAPEVFCPNCGQKQLDRRITIRHLVVDFIEDQFGLNAKAGRTMRALLFHPGRLSTEYFNGHIERYVQPFKLYLIASVLFFLLVNLVTARSSEDISRGIREAQDSVAFAPDDTARGPNLHFGLWLEKIPSDNWLRDARVNFGIPALNRVAERHLHELAALGPEEGTRRLVRSGLNQIPKVLFCLLPIYALLLYAFYWGKRRFYVEHFVFALHLHSFAFLVLTLLLLQIALLDTVVLLWIGVYVIVAQRRFYQQSYSVVLLKTFFLLIAYAFVFTIGFMGLLALALTTA